MNFRALAEIARAQDAILNDIRDVRVRFVERHIYSGRYKSYALTARWNHPTLVIERKESHGT